MSASASDLSEYEKAASGHTNRDSIELLVARMLRHGLTWQTSGMPGADGTPQLFVTIFSSRDGRIHCEAFNLMEHLAGAVKNAPGDSGESDEAPSRAMSRVLPSAISDGLYNMLQTTLSKGWPKHPALNRRPQRPR